MSSANPAIASLRRPLPPLEFALRAAAPGMSKAPLRRSRRQIAVGLAMYGTAVWMAVDNAAFRHSEAKLITPVAGSVVGSHGAVNSNALVYFALGTPRAFGLQITNECTSALLLIPLLVMMGSFAAFTRLALWRQLAALLVGTVIIVSVNVIRVTGIAYATWRWGFDPGYAYSHVFVGSAFSLIGFVGAMLTALWILVRGDRSVVRGGRHQFVGAKSSRLGRHIPAEIDYRVSGRTAASPKLAVERFALIVSLLTITLCCLAILVTQSIVIALLLSVTNIGLLALQRLR